MYSVSQAFLTAVNSNARRYYWTGTITTTDGTVYNFENKDIVKGSGYITRSCCGSSEIELGSVYAAEMGISLFSTIDRYSLEDAVIRLYYNLYLPNNSVETIPMGVFEISEANRKVKTLELKAYDYMLRFDDELDIEASSGTPYSFLHTVCEHCDVEMAQTQEEIANLPNGSAILSIYKDNDIDTFRDIIFYIAQALGCVAQIDRLGRLVLIPYSNTITATIPQTQRFDSNYSDFVTRYTAVSSTNVIKETSEYYALEVDDGLTMNLGINPMLQFNMVTTRERFLRNILNSIAIVEYVPCEVTTIGNPALDPMDVIQFTGGQADSTKKSCITSITYKINGKHSVKCVGKNPKLAAAKSKNQKNISSIMSQVETKKTVVYDFVNVDTFSIGSTDTEIISIDFVSLESTSAMFLAEVLLDVTANDTARTVSGTATYTEEETEVEKAVSFAFTDKTHPVVKVTYKINASVFATFIPQQVMHEGKQVLTLFLPIPSITASSTNNLCVLLSVTNGTATIGEEQIRATISGQGLVAGIGDWNGRLSFEDEVEGFGITMSSLPVSTLGGMLDSVSIQNIPRANPSFADYVSDVSINALSLPNITVRSYSEQFGKSVIVCRNIIATAYKERYEYNTAYLSTVDGEFKLRTEYPYTGQTETVDRGKLTKMHLPFENYEEISEVEIKQ